MRHQRNRARLIDDDPGLRRVLMRTRRMAILGIKPEEREAKPAFYVPRYLQRVGYKIVPVPVYYLEVSAILGEPVVRRLVDVADPLDMLVVFRRAEHIPMHVAEVIARQPRVVWFQLGIRNDDAAHALLSAGISVVQDRCTMLEHRRLIAGV
jgi:predicted CoA-binding protein